MLGFLGSVVVEEASLLSRRLWEVYETSVKNHLWCWDMMHLQDKSPCRKVCTLKWAVHWSQIMECASFVDQCPVVEYWGRPLNCNNCASRHTYEETEVAAGMNQSIEQGPTLATVCIFFFFFFSRTLLTFAIWLVESFILQGSLTTQPC